MNYLNIVLLVKKKSNEMKEKSEKNKEVPFVMKYVMYCVNYQKVCDVLCKLSESV